MSLKIVGKSYQQKDLNILTTLHSFTLRYIFIAIFEINCPKSRLFKKGSIYFLVAKRTWKLSLWIKMDE